MGEISSDIRARRSVVTGNRKPSHLQGQALDRLLRMQRPSGDGSGVLIDEIGGWKIDASYQRRYFGAK
jgi:hypothetical protein